MSDERIQGGNPKATNSDIREGSPPFEAFLDKNEISKLGFAEPSSSDIVAAWRNLRILFNLILMLSVILSYAFGPSPIQTNLGCDEALFLMLIPFVVFNIFYNLGPDAEGLLCWLGVDRSWARGICFSVGAIVAALVIVSIPILFDRWFTSLDS